MNSIVIDIILLVISAIIIIISNRRGFFKTVINFVSVIASIFVAFAFSPRVSDFFYNNFFLDEIAKSINGSLTSLVQTTTETAEGVIYDLTKLIDNSQFNDIVTRFGADKTQIETLIPSVNDGTEAAVEKVSYAVANPLAEKISAVLAFIIVFVVSMLILRLVTGLIGLLFKLPVLRGIDRTLGTIFGILCAIIFLMIFTLLASDIGWILGAVAPAVFSQDTVENSILVKLFSSINIVEWFGNIAGAKI